MPSARIRHVGERAGTWTDGPWHSEVAVTSASGTTPVAELIAALTRNVADFPEPGVQFKDLTPLFADRAGMTAVTDALADIASGADLVAGIDSRGFLVAAAARRPPAARSGRAAAGRAGGAGGGGGGRDPPATAGRGGRRMHANQGKD